MLHPQNTCTVIVFVFIYYIYIYLRVFNSTLSPIQTFHAMFQIKGKEYVILCDKGFVQLEVYI